MQSSSASAGPPKTPRWARLTQEVVSRLNKPVDQKTLEDLLFALAVMSQYRTFMEHFANLDREQLLVFCLALTVHRYEPFQAVCRMGEPPTYAIVERETVSLHLMPASQDPAGLGRSSIYVYVDDVDALHAGLVAMGCPIEIAPEDFFYGMRETSVRDPDGNRITFGAEVRPPA